MTGCREASVLWQKDSSWSLQMPCAADLSGASNPAATHAGHHQHHKHAWLPLQQTAVCLHRYAGPDWCKPGLERMRWHDEGCYDVQPSILEFSPPEGLECCTSAIPKFPNVITPELTHRKRSIIPCNSDIESCFQRMQHHHIDHFCRLT